MEAVIGDVKSFKGKKINKADVKAGFSYSNMINSKKDRVKATVVKFDKPHVFCLKIKSDSGTTTLNY